MFRQLIGSEAGDPAIFSVPFLGEKVSLNRPKQLFILSASGVNSYWDMFSRFLRHIHCTGEF